jgi:hypothetical protein
MNLSYHFTLEEMIATEHRDIDNTPTAPIIAHLGQICATLEQVRALLGNGPIHINSGYRCLALNTAVGGAPDSAHMQGWAADFIQPAFGAPIDICRAIVGSAIIFDQIIEEGTWVHLSVAPTLRRSILTKLPGGGYRNGLP